MNTVAEKIYNLKAERDEEIRSRYVALVEDAAKKTKQGKTPADVLSSQETAWLAEHLPELNFMPGDFESDVRSLVELRAARKAETEARTRQRKIDESRRPIAECEAEWVAESQLIDFVGELMSDRARALAVECNTAKNDLGDVQRAERRVAEASEKISSIMAGSVCTS